jgi:antitoxin component YwqK of YwqJK toxin-antitoxin module
MFHFNLMNMHKSFFKPLIFIVLVLFFVQVNAQQQGFNQTDSKGLKQGPWRGYFESGALRYDGQFEDDLPVGVFKYYYPEGSIRTELIHQKGEKSVKGTYYHRNGRILGEGFFVDQSKEGLWRYFSETGVLIAENFYQDNKNHGVWKTYYPTGKLAELVTWHRGMKHGPWEKYLTDGTLLLKASFQNDKLHGPYQLYHRNSKPMVLGQYKENLQDDIWVHYSENGELEKRMVYDMGTVVKEEILIDREEESLPISPGNPSVPSNPFGIDRR